MEAGLRGEVESDVPCGTCTACCRSSQFVLVTPDDVGAIAHIPNELLFPAPLQPKGYLVMGYNEQGHCPMFVDNQCSIYDNRPRTCREYDCRVFPAAEIPVGVEKPLVAQQVDRWRFSYDDDTSRAKHDAVRAAAVFIRSNRDELPSTVLPRSSARHAIMAIEMNEMFLDGEPDIESVRSWLLDR